MSAQEFRERLIRSLLAEIDDVQFPSVTMMDRVEGTLATPGDLANYTEVLVKKVEATRYPSISLLNRIDGLLGQLEQLEQRQQLEAARGDGSGRS